MKIEDIPQDVRDSLTEEELAGMLDQDLVDEGLEDKEEDKPKKEPKDEPKPEEIEPKEEPKREPKEEPKAEDPPKVEPEKKEPAAERKPRPLLQVDANVEDIDRQISAIKDGKQALAKQFDEGEITFADMQAKMSDLTDSEYALREQKLKASIASEANQSQVMETWESACHSFLSTHEEISKTQLRYASFDLAVRAVTGDEANANLSPQAMLQKAYDTWAAEFGITADQKQSEKTGATKGKPPVVPTLGNIPASETTDTDDGRFAALTRLAETNPIEFERKLSKLSEADREAYLMSAS